MNDRLVALTLLKNCLQNSIPLAHLFKSQPTTPFSKEICFGVCRHYYSLSMLTNQLLKKKPKELELWLVIIIGFYQLHYLNKPDYAVVKEMVDLLTQIKKPWAKGLVNAVLRNYCRNKENLKQTLSTDETAQYEHPRWLIDEIKCSWPLNWQSILSSNNLHPPMSLRINPNNLSEANADQLKHDAQQIPYCPNGIILNKPCSVESLPGFKEGHVSLQDGAAQLAVSLMDLKPKIRVLDACAAPGGKFCHILETEPQLSECIAVDIDEHRLKKIEENLHRLNLKGTLIQGDASKPSEWWDGQAFDRILLDAPCSATGVIRRHPDIKLLRTKDEISTITKLQHELLRSLWPLLAPNGLLIYATCSIIPEENEKQIQAFCEEHTDCSFETLDIKWGHLTGHGWQILPGENNMDGFFYSVLRKCSSVPI